MADTQLAPSRFTSDVPPQSGWYFSSNNLDDPTNGSLGYYDADKRTYMTFDPILLEVCPHDRGVCVWLRTETERPHKWLDPESGGSWRGPDVWYGPVCPDWEAIF